VGSEEEQQGRRKERIIKVTFGTFQMKGKRKTESVIASEYKVTVQRKCSKRIKKGGGNGNIEGGRQT